MYAASPWQKRFLVPRVVSSHRMLTLLCITLRNYRFSEVFGKVLGIVGGFFIDADVMPPHAQLQLLHRSSCIL